MPDVLHTPHSCWIYMHWCIYTINCIKSHVNRAEVFNWNDFNQKGKHVTAASVVFFSWETGSSFFFKAAVCCPSVLSHLLVPNNVLCNVSIRCETGTQVIAALFPLPSSCTGVQLCCDITVGGGVAQR